MGLRLLRDPHREGRQAPKPTVIASRVALVVVSVGTITWSVTKPPNGPEASQLVKTPAVSAPTVRSGADSGPTPRQAQTTAVPDKQAGAVKPLDPNEQVPRADLVIHYLADTRGTIEPCG